MTAAVVLLGACVPVIANADEFVTLNYQSTVLTGDYSYLPTGISNSGPIPSAPFTGILTGSVLFDETTLALNGVAGPISYDFELTGSGVTDVEFGSTAPTFITYAAFYSGNDACANAMNTICVITQNGVITGAGVGLINNAYHSSPTQLSIGPLGDSASYLFGTTLGGCESYQRVFDTGSTYTGDTISPCYVQASDAAAGTWTVSTTNAPEMDPGFAGSGLTLLAGCLAVLRGRRRARA
jgi:hypothetical protein